MSVKVFCGDLSGGGSIHRGGNLSDGGGIHRGGDLGEGGSVCDGGMCDGDWGVGNGNWGSITVGGSEHSGLGHGREGDNRNNLKKRFH
jgi:hypothetical protein